jgi:hypothetical protein
VLKKFLSGFLVTSASGIFELLVRLSPVRSFLVTERWAVMADSGQRIEKF